MHGNGRCWPVLSENSFANSSSLRMAGGRSTTEILQDVVAKILEWSMLLLLIMKKFLLLQYMVQL